MDERRCSARLDSSGKAKITAVPDCKFLVKNLSITGCCIEGTPCTDKIKLNEHYDVKIIPDHTFHVHDFELRVECKWIWIKGSSAEYGFEISSFPKGKEFQNYVNFLSLLPGFD